VIVRRATAADAAEMGRVHTASSAAAYRHVVAEDPYGLERRTKVWSEILAGDHRAHVAEDDGSVVGVLNVAGDELHAIYVHPDWWGSGAGQALLEKAHDLLAETCDEAQLTCLADNPRARRFYERNGWIVDREVTEPHFGGVPTRVVKYRKRLVSATEAV
jgi:GNAT superfamily N-acetyltransferase